MTAYTMAEMFTRRRRWAAVLIWTAVLAVGTGAPPAAAKIGLSTQFVDVVFENLKPGRRYNVREIQGVPYTVKNRGDGLAEVMIEAVIPKKTKLIEPFEPIPDPSWVTLSPSVIKIGAESVGFSDIIIDLPDDPSIVGRHFQVMLWAHTVNTGLLAAGVKTRMRFSVGPGPESIDRERKNKAMVTLNYDLWPTALYVKNAQAGKRYDVKEREKKGYIMTNRGEEELELVPVAVPWPKGSIALPEGYEYVEDLSWVSVAPGTFTLAGLSVQQAGLVLNPPDSLKGKKVAFLLELRLPVGTPISSLHRVFVSIDE